AVRASLGRQGHAAIDISAFRATFHRLFGQRATVFRAPGRVNLIGEHTDYNDGFVLPMAIDFHTYVAYASRADGKLRVHSSRYSESVELSLVELQPVRQRAASRVSWSDYVGGVAWSLTRSGIAVRGADLLIDGDLPLGAGLSSSAALEVAVALALTDRLDR